MQRPAPTARATPGHAQRERLARFGVKRTVDLHCHCLPGLDDGPPHLEEAVELCKALAADGTTAVIATPHQLGRYDLSNSGPAIRRAVESLNAELTRRAVPLAVLPGGDVRLDERLADLIDDGTVLRLADGPWLLLELPHEIWVDPTVLIEDLARRGTQTIVSHPERHAGVQDAPHRVGPWLEAGAALQITAGSVCGEFGPRAHDAAWSLIRGGAVSIVASDAHDTHRRPPRMSQAIRLIAREMGDAVARSLCIDNPARIVAGESLVP